MSQDIQFSVGHVCRNKPDDVVKVQRRLLLLGYKLGSADGVCGKRTKSVIVAFQGTFLKHPDGRIEQRGKTWKKLRERTDKLLAAPASSGARAASGVTAKAPLVQIDYTKLVTKPPTSTINAGLSSPSNDFLIKKFGKPRDNFTQLDQPITNKALLALMKTDSVGPFRAWGLGQALDSLKLVFADIKGNLPDLYNKIGNSGMTVCRYQRGSTTKISNHSWGTAIDLNINKLLDARGDGMTQTGLVMIAPFFNKYKWYWGASFPTEDSMHFECSTELLQTFKS